MINSDLNIVYTAFFAYWLVLIFLILVCKNKRKNAIINISIHAFYSLILVYMLSTSQGYASMGMFFALLFTLGIHGSINLIQLIYVLV